jgi:hypothetical protein
MSSEHEDHEDNYIVEEVRRVREELLKRYGGDLRALMRDMQRQTEEAAAAGRPVVDLAARRRAQQSNPPEPTKKAS